MHTAGLSVQRGIQRKRPVAIILEPVPLGTAGRERQYRVQSVQSLNGGLFIHTQHSGMLRRIQVQTDNIGCLALKIRIIVGPKLP